MARRRGAYDDEEDRHYTPLLQAVSNILAVLLSSGATYNMGLVQAYGYPRPTYGNIAVPKYGDTDYPDGGYLARVAAGGGWKRYEQAHRKQLVSMFVPKLRLPADVLSLVADFWAHIGYY